MQVFLWRWVQVRILALREGLFFFYKMFYEGISCTDQNTVYLLASLNCDKCMTWKNHKNNQNRIFLLSHKIFFIPSLRQKSPRPHSPNPHIHHTASLGLDNFLICTVTPDSFWHLEFHKLELCVCVLPLCDCVCLVKCFWHLFLLRASLTCCFSFRSHRMHRRKLPCIYWCYVRLSLYHPKGY